MRRAASTALLTVVACCTGAVAQTASATAPELQSWHLCQLIGPAAQRPGVFGTDLGFAFVHPHHTDSGAVDERLVLLFGDTWPTFDSPCTEPPWRNDDAVATVRVADLPDYPPGPPPGAPGSARCPVLEFGGDDPLHDRPLRVLDGDRDLDMGYGRTPLAGWSDGRRIHGLFTAAELAWCSSDADCGAGRQCLRGELGRCAVPPCPAGESCPPDPGFDDVLSAAPCRLDGNDCAVPYSPRRTCSVPAGGDGLCTDPGGSLWLTAQEAHPDAPDRRVLATRWVHVAAEDPARPSVFETVARFPTARFLNPAARTIAGFDPDDPAGSDYRHGYDTLLLWGRPFFVGLDGAQAWLYLLYNRLEPASPAGPMRWAPRYFAGLGDDGRPRWSDRETDAAPLYRSEIDMVNQLSVAFIEPLGVWVMLYGGDQPSGLRGPQPRVHEAPAPGAVHLRWAPQPWGPWSEPYPVLRPADAPQILACPQPGVPAGRCAPGDRVRPLDFFRGRLTGADCRAGSAIPDPGVLYSANVIDVLTRPVPARRPGAKAAELVWTVSTWNPYAVELLKTRIELGP